MKYPLEIELRQYRQAVVAGLSDSTRQQARMLSRQDDGLTALIGGLNFVGSGLADVESSLDEIETDLARLVTVADSALPSIVEYLAITAKEIKDISQMMATPEETRAAERFRTGTIALAKAQQAGSPERAQKWYDLAAHDLREAVEIHKYHPKSWFNLGITLGRLGRTEEAAEAFESSAFFGVDQSLEFGATAVLLAAGLYRQVNLSDKSADILHEYLGQLDRCAEIHLALAVHHSAPGELRRALELWPFLAVDARAAGMKDAEQVAASICSRDDSAVAYLNRLQQALDSLGKAATTIGLELIGPKPPVVLLPEPGVEALIFTSSAIPIVLEGAKRLAAENSIPISRMSAGTQDALSGPEQVSRSGSVHVEQIRRAGTARIQELRLSVEREARKVAEEASEVRRRAFYHHQDTPIETPPEKPWLRHVAETERLKKKAAIARDEVYRAERQIAQLGSPVGHKALRRLARAKEEVLATEQGLANLKQQEPHFAQLQHKYQLAARRAATVALREAEIECEDSLRAAEAEAAQALRVAQEAAEAEAAPVLRVANQLQVLKAVIAAALSLTPRIIPFDLQGF
jgi:tetratricopeptide (TPR) repeat protein